jgi:hypothetical protein
MKYVVIAVSLLLMAQAPGSAPIQKRRGQGAPPAAAPQQVPSGGLGFAPDMEVEPSDPYGSPPATGAPAAAAQPAEAMESLGNQQPRQRLRPPELIAEALENPKQAALVGTPITLGQAMAKARDRQQQLNITKAYWQLTATQAEYHWSLVQRDLLRDQTRSHTNQPGTLSARAAARADVRAAQLNVENAQATLANAIGDTADHAAYLTSDRPHVGDYRTYYESLFGNRQPPARLQLVHRTLPVRRKAIDAHGEAIVAALDAVEATGEQFRTSGQGLSTLLDAIDQLKRERQAFIAEVREYNVDIADYAFSVAPANANSDTLVSMLIRTSAPATAAEPKRTADPTEPALRRSYRPNQPAQDAGALLESSAAQPRTAYYLAQGGGENDRGWYEALLDVSNTPLRVQKLGNLLHWDRNLASDAGQPVGLAECLRDVPPQNRLAAIAAFWNAREKAAELQLLHDQLDQLNSLQSLALPHAGDAGRAEAAVRLHAARRSTRAAILDAQLALMASQSELMQTIGRTGNWILPSTPPQSGRYVVAIQARRGHARGAKWAERLGLEYDKLQHRADALMQADAHRAEMLRLARQPDGQPAPDDRMSPLDRVLWALTRENQLARGFLRDLTEYNMAIANYAILTLPETVSGEKLAGKLAIARSTMRDS